MQLKAKDLCQAEKKIMGPWVGEFNIITIIINLLVNLRLPYYTKLSDISTVKILGKHADIVISRSLLVIKSERVSKS